MREMNDKCGPQPDPNAHPVVYALQILLSWLIPDRIWCLGWVDMSCCCGCHDDGYEYNPRRKKVDESFRRCIRKKFHQHADTMAMKFMVVGLFSLGSLGAVVFFITSYAIIRITGLAVSWWYFLFVRGFGWLFHQG